MKYATAWWGVQILAENKEDRDLLMELKKRLPIEPEHTYEGGQIEFPNRATTWGFTQEEIDNAELVIEFHR